MLTNDQLEVEKVNHQEERNGFWFDGRHTSEFDMYVEKRPVQKTPRRKRTVVSVPGRNGDLHYTEDAFENYEQPYECYFHGPEQMPTLAHTIKDWLHGDGSYRELYDSYDPGCFRMAVFVGPMDIANTLNKYGRCTVIFDCMPQNFLRSGREPITFREGGKIRNPTGQTSKPIVTIYGTGPGTVTIGNATITVRELEDQITLDCELQHAYRQIGDAPPENKNNAIYAIPFPELAGGENPVSWTGGISYVEIIPRWWTL